MDLPEDGGAPPRPLYFYYCAALTMTSGKFDRLFWGSPAGPPTPHNPAGVRPCGLHLEGHRDGDFEDGGPRPQADRIRNLVLRAVSRSIAWQTAGSCANGPSTTSGSSLPPATRGGRWVRPLRLAPAPRAELRPEAHDSQNGSLLGPACSAGATEALMRARRRVPSPRRGTSRGGGPADANGRVIGWFQGPPSRPAGARREAYSRRRSQRRDAAPMNLKIKFRETFRPFAPIVLRDRVHEYFELEPGVDSPYVSWSPRSGRTRGGHAIRAPGNRPRLGRIAMLRTKRQEPHSRWVMGDSGPRGAPRRGGAFSGRPW